MSAPPTRSNGGNHRNESLRLQLLPARAFFLLPLPQPDTWAAAVLVDELHPGNSNARRIAKSLALVSAVWFSFSSARRMVATLRPTQRQDPRGPRNERTSRSDLSAGQEEERQRGVDFYSAHAMKTII